MSQAVAYNSFPVVAGQDIDLNLTIQDSAGTTVDLTGATLRFVLTTPNNNGIVLDSDSSPQGATYAITSAADGEVTVSITDENMDGLLGDYYYEVKVTDSAGDEGVTNRGIITVEEAVT